VIFDFCGLEESFGESLSLPTSIFHASLTTLFFQPHLPQQPQPQPQPPAAQQSFLQSVPVKLHLHRLRALRMNDVAHLRDLRLKAKAEEGKKAAHSNKKNINKVCALPVFLSLFPLFFFFFLCTCESTSRKKNASTDI
jgi:hypothetical protein